MRFSANTNSDWSIFGEVDPYYGVLSHEKFRASQMDNTTKEEFFLSGVVHVKNCLRLIDKHFSPRPTNKALDFGCGVGRLTNALASHFSEVVGLDIAPGMLREATCESEKRGVKNVVYALSTEESRFSRGTYDFIHSYIVLQHIPVAVGEEFIRKMAVSLKEGGLGAIHFTVASPRVKVVTRSREIVKRYLPLRALANIARGEKWNSPAMQMNRYNLPRILRILSAENINEVVVHQIDDWGHPGAFLFFQKPTSTSPPSSWSNPVRKTL